MPSTAPDIGAPPPAVRGGRFARLLVVGVLFPWLVVFGGSSTANAGFLVVPAVAAAGVPLSVVSAGVGGGVALVSTGGALAGAAITAAAALAGSWAVETLFSWDSDAPSDLGDVPVTSGTYGPTVGQYYRFDGPPGSSVKYDYDVVNVGRTVYFTASLDTGRTLGTSMAVKVQCKNPTTGELRAITGNGLGGFGSSYSGTSAQTGGCATTTDVVAGFSYHVLNGTTFAAPPSTEALNAPAFLSAGTIGAPSGAPAAGAGETPLTVTPRTCWTRLADNSTGCTNGAPLDTKRNAPGGLLAFPAPPSGATVTGRAAPITRTSDGVLIADATDPTGGTSPWSPPAVPAVYPDCANRACVMTLTVTDPAGNMQTCGPANGCASYAQVVQQYPQVGEAAGTGPRQAPDGSSYQCRFGAYPVAVAECQVIPGVGLPATTTDAGNCMGGVGWNPTTWVTVPVKCALEWAFVPSAAPLAQAQVTATDLGNAAPFSYVKGTVGWVNTLGAGSQCFTLDVTTQQGPQRVLSTCDPGPFESWLVSNRTLLSAAMYASFFVPLGWWAWRQYAPGAQGMA